MTTILFLNPYNKSILSEKDIIDENISETLIFKFKIVEDLTITQYIDELADIIVTEYIDDDMLNNFYFELQIFTKSYMIPVIYAIDPEKINDFPVSFIDDSSDFIYKPINKSELISRIKLAILKNSQLKNNVQIDRVTGMPNYKSFYRRFNEETLKCLRYKRMLSVSIIHIKNLMDLKNEIGWYFCDLIMAELAYLIKKSLREVDYLARYSFDRFILLLPETDDFNSRIALNRIIEKIKYYIYVLPDESKKEISVAANASAINYPEITNDSIELIKILNNSINTFSEKSEFEVEIISNSCLAKRNILIIEDDQEIFHYIKELLSDKSIELIWLTKSTPELHKIIVEQKISLAIIDIMLPDSEKDGYEIIESLKNNSLTAGISILVVTAKGGPLKIMESGADDYLLKPFDSSEFIGKINMHLNKRAIQFSNKLIEHSNGADQNSYYYFDKGSDKLTKLPLLNAVLDEIKILFKNSPNFGIIYINVAKFNEIEINYGEKVFDNLLIKTAELLKNMKGTIIRNNDIIAITRMWDDDFIIFLSPPRYQEKIRISDVNEIKGRIEKYLKSNKNKLISRGLEYQFDFYLGYSIIDLNREIKFERTVYTNLKNAMMMAYDKESQVSLALQSEFKEILAAENVSIVYQPIIDLEAHKIIGFEALVRGPKNTMLYRPVILFNMAYQTNKIWELERIIRKKALISFMNSSDACHLFLSLNVEPASFSDPEFRKFAEMNPDNYDFTKIILEITERTNITDLQKFKEQLQLFKNCKFTIAIDDAGSGYASLFYIAELKPDIIKLDISLVKNINENNPRSDIVRALVKFANQHNIKVLAEGIETEAELEEIKKIGINLGQGFYFAEGKPELITKLQNAGEQ